MELLKEMIVVAVAHYKMELLKEMIVIFVAHLSQFEKALIFKQLYDHKPVAIELRENFKTHIA